MVRGNDVKIIDMHCDTIHKIWQNNAKENPEASVHENLESDELMINLEKMKQGGYSVQNFAMFIEADDTKDCFKRFNDLLSVFREQMDIYKDIISPVTNASEIYENERIGKLSAFLTVEGGEACQGDIEKLHYLYAQGVRMMTLTWNFPNELGYPNIDAGKMKFKDDSFRCSPYIPDTTHGLTDKGIEFVREMERIGMIIDVSHLSDAGFYDVLKYTKKPFVASHSNAREVCPFVRNLTDDMIRQLGERGGVTGLNYCHDFLFNDTIDEEMRAIAYKYKFADKGLDNIDNEGKSKDYNDRYEQDRRIKDNNVSCDRGKIISERFMDITYNKIAEHARHIVNVGGMGVLGLGSDFDGIPCYSGMPEADRLNYLAYALHKQGFSDGQIEDIFYKNVMRVYKELK